MLQITKSFPFALRPHHHLQGLAYRVGNFSPLNNLAYPMFSSLVATSCRTNVSDLTTPTKVVPAIFYVGSIKWSNHSNQLPIRLPPDPLTDRGRTRLSVKSYALQAQEFGHPSPILGLILQTDFHRFMLEFSFNPLWLTAVPARVLNTDSHGIQFQNPHGVSFSPKLPALVGAQRRAYHYPKLPALVGSKPRAHQLGVNLIKRYTCLPTHALPRFLIMLPAIGDMLPVIGEGDLDIEDDGLAEIPAGAAPAAPVAGGADEPDAPAAGGGGGQEWQEVRARARGGPRQPRRGPRHAGREPSTMPKITVDDPRWPRGQAASVMPIFGTADVPLCTREEFQKALIWNLNPHRDRALPFQGIYLRCKGYGYGCGISIVMKRVWHMRWYEQHIDPFAVDMPARCHFHGGHEMKNNGEEAGADEEEENGRGGHSRNRARRPLHHPYAADPAGARSDDDDWGRAAFEPLPPPPAALYSQRGAALRAGGFPPADDAALPFAGAAAHPPRAHGLGGVATCAHRLTSASRTLTTWTPAVTGCRRTRSVFSPLPRSNPHGPVTFVRFGSTRFRLMAATSSLLVPSTDGVPSFRI